MGVLVILPPAWPGSHGQARGLNLESPAANWRPSRAPGRHADAFNALSIVLDATRRPLTVLRHVSRLKALRPFGPLPAFASLRPWTTDGRVTPPSGARKRVAALPRLTVEGRHLRSRTDRSAGVADARTPSAGPVALDVRYTRRPASGTSSATRDRRRRQKRGHRKDSRTRRGDPGPPPAPAGVPTSPQGFRRSLDPGSVRVPVRPADARNGNFPPRTEQRKIDVENT